MSSSNVQKKKQIDDILAKHDARMAVVKQKRDKIIFRFSRSFKRKENRGIAKFT